MGRNASIFARLLHLAPVFVFALATPLNARAQRFFLQGADGEDGERGRDGAQGPPGDPELVCDDGVCTLEGDLTMEGELEVTGSGSFESASAAGLDVTRNIQLSECPSGYDLDDEEGDFILCVRDLGGALDQMVRVGDIWVDRYEATVWERPDCAGEQYGDNDDWMDVGETFPSHGQFSAPLYACSVEGELPSRFLTWFQAQAACVASGKHLITDAEWQAAVAGTHDPGAHSGAGGACVTDAEGPRDTGEGSSCVSYWGAEDMIGNLWEMTADWRGQDGLDSTHPPGFFSDRVASVDPAERQLEDTLFQPFVLRGGSWSDGARAGAFAWNLEYGPSWQSPNIGFRCARGR